MKIFLLIISLFSTLTNSSCSDEKIELNLAQSNYKILFVGNSLTYTNNLPELVKTEAANRGLTISTEMIALANYALEDHLIDGNFQALIETGEFDYVLIQQGPSSQPYGRETLIEFGATFKTLCQDNNAELVYFMVWPSRIYYNTFDGVINNYRDAANINEALLCPVGEVWKTHFDNTDMFDYYGTDNFHPSLLGSQVAARVIVESIFD